jgi:hypothetical protein
MTYSKSKGEITLSKRSHQAAENVKSTIAKSNTPLFYY